MRKKERGITLVELLITIAIVSVLATMIVTQLATFAVRTENATAVADLRAAAAVQETMMANHYKYGRSAFAAIPGPGGWGPGSILIGPSTWSTPTNPTTTLLTTTDIVGTWRDLEIQLSSDVSFVANTDYLGTTYTMGAKHLLGDTVFGMDADTRAIYMAKNPMWVGMGLGMAPVPAVPAATQGVIDFVPRFTAM